MYSIHGQDSKRTGLVRGCKTAIGIFENVNVEGCEQEDRNGFAFKVGN